MQVSGILYTLEQFACALCLLSALGRAARLPSLPLVRLTLLSGVSTVCCVLAAYAPAFRFPALMLVALLPRAAWPRLPRRFRLTLPVIHLALALLLGGCIRFLLSLGLSGPLSLLTALPVLLLLSRAPSQTLPHCVAVDVRCGAARVTLTALIDTGNLLRDPLTALPVVVISRQAALRLIPLPRPGLLNPGLRQISVRTVAGVSSMTVFRPSSIRFRLDGTWTQVQAIVGIAPDGYNGVQALAPASLLQPSSQTLTQGG